MNFDLNEDQQLFRDAVERFLGPVDIAARRTQRSADHRYPDERWLALVDLGLLALAVPETMGGLGGSRIDLALVAEALGYGLAVDPWLECGVLPLRIAAAAGAGDLVATIAAGTVRTALAFAEPARRYALAPAVRVDARSRLSGEKTFVLGGGRADMLIVTAANDDGFAICLIAADADGINRRNYAIVDGSEACEVRFFEAPSTRYALPFVSFMDAIGDIRLLAAAEMVGLMQRLFDDTLAYVKQREQFGVAIGSFQAIQHRLVDCYAQLELARSLVLRTALEPANDWPAIAGGTKAFVGSIAMQIAHEATQLHGGMGVTDDLAIGHALKRIMLLDKLFGDEAANLVDYARAA